MKVVCPGSFDPITLGHLDVITRSRDLFGEVVVAVGRNSTKKHIFSVDERVDLVRQSVADLEGVSVGIIDDLLVNFCHEVGATAIVKGLRFASDFDYELQMAHMNSHAGKVETIFLPASPTLGTLSSTMMRQIAHYGGDVSTFLTPVVNEAIVARMAELRGAQ
ncbi:pantetheine-phosphate adenylyltransferase [Propionibacteriaceae bacterium G1746]|uniref:pantetheine-phosphate adenylyltransferase n=1 Tax=Aestuariimicrobium sp. G57 TaxID=3418485 RepID=UPI003C248D30